MNKELDKIVFHDLPVDKITLDKSDQNLIIDVSIFNESIERNSTKSIDFQVITIINFDKTLLEQHDDLEIYSFDYEWINQTFYGKIILLLGFGKPSAIIEFECKQIQIQSKY